jgi:hypothetical protein
MGTSQIINRDFNLQIQKFDLGYTNQQTVSESLYQFWESLKYRQFSKYHYPAFIYTGPGFYQLLYLYAAKCSAVFPWSSVQLISGGWSPKS